MEFEDFMKYKRRLKEIGVSVPDYYFFIDDTNQLTPVQIGKIFGRSPKVVRDWFSKGLKKQGRIQSQDPTRRKVSGYELKRWCYKKDIEELAQDDKFRYFFD
ncbi:hypothetical protein [Neobacillus soli]|uniref:hypothetical protein n=1 Tax=Neobacillus soli TaxID=220688 RepID=UPI000824E5D5|nr:hypothetical protein [Neobacillus soli]